MHRHVLIVEDDDDIRGALASALDALGYHVEVAENGQKALEILRSQDHPCLILLDLMMPVMDGWEFRKQQLSDPGLAAIPTIVISADGRARQKAQLLQIKEALIKPIEFNSLMELTQNYCG